MSSPISSDDSKRQGATFSPPRGPGLYITYRCARCRLAKPCLGRKLQLVQGIKQFVCKDCVK